MKRLNLIRIIDACHLSFQGLPDNEVAKKINISTPTISRWRKMPIWKEMEMKLIEKTIDQKINEKSKNDIS